MNQLLSVWSFAAPEQEHNGLLSPDHAHDQQHDRQHDRRRERNPNLWDTSEDSGIRKAADNSQSSRLSASEQPEASTCGTGTVKDVQKSGLHAGEGSQGLRSREAADDWFNHQAFDKEPSRDDDADTEVQALTSKDTGVSRRQNRQANNREHQRRWRLRQKERSQSVQKQLCVAAAEVEELKRRQQQLEVQSQVHEGVQTCSPAVESTFCVNELPAATEATPNGEPFVPADCFDACNKPILTISLGVKKLNASSQEISCMPVEDFASLWTAYNVELRQCLVSLSCSLEEHVESRMHQLALEALRLVGCRISLNPAVHKALVNGRGSLGQVALHQLDRTFYTSLLIVLALSEEQVQDLMLLRLLYHSKRSQLRQERRQLVNQMSVVEDQCPHPCQHVVEMTNLSTLLKDNSRENHQLFYRIARVVYRGLFSTRQSADIIVHSYPYMPLIEILLDTIAAQAGYPSRQEIEAAAPLDPLTADWEMFGEYAKFIASHQTHSYLQMCQHNGSQRWWLHRCPSSADLHS